MSPDRLRQPSHDSKCAEAAKTRLQFSQCGFPSDLHHSGGLKIDVPMNHRHWNYGEKSQ
jgi:hypothetical protein